MKSPHIPPEMIERLLQADLTPEEGRELVRGLLALDPEDGAKPWAARPRTYEEALRRAMHTADAWEEVVARQRAVAAAQWAELRRWPAERRSLRVRNDRRLWSWSLCDHLLEESREALAADPGLAAETARLALEVTERLEEGAYGRERLADLRALGWSALAEALRLQRELPGAMEALDRAREANRNGTGDPLLEAHLLGREAALLADLDCPEIAAGLLDRAIARYRRAGETHREGSALAQKAAVVAATDPERAAFLLWRALHLIDPERDPRLAARVRSEVVCRDDKK